jgi:GntR family transcriptional regulator
MSRAAVSADGNLAVLDDASHVPLYQQLVLQLQNRIGSGEFGPGAVVPGEFDLSRDYGVSRITAKRALVDRRMVRERQPDGARN